MDNLIYIAFLFGVGRNSATFGTYTKFNRAAENNSEFRVPSALSAEKLNEVFLRN